MLRRILLLSVTLSSAALAGCASSDADSVPADTGADVIYSDATWTGRPDDGIDTGAPDTGSDTGEDATEDTATDATDATTDAADAATDATDAATDAPEATPSAARIHEVYVDRALEGDCSEYVEISAPEGVALDVLRIRALNPDGSVRMDLPVADAGEKMPAKGLWVVGCTASLSYSADKGYLLSEWGLNSTSGAIQLTRNDGEVIELVDVVAYASAPAAPATDPKTVVEGSPAAVAASGSEGKTIGRKSVPGDSNDNGSDFCVMNATPGAANGACLP